METLHTCGEFRLRVGNPLPFGVNFTRGGINFSVFSANATGCFLVLFRLGEVHPYVEIPFPEGFRIGQVFAMTVEGLKPEEWEYGFRMVGPYDPKEGHLFDGQRFLLDPEARTVSGYNIWRKRQLTQHEEGAGCCSLRARLVSEEEFFDWRGDQPLCLQSNELVIYEMHVRGFTRHDSSGVTAAAGTFEGMKEKIPYLKELGINCVELMPIFEFDELENPFVNPLTGSLLYNYWGYSTLAFYAPKAGFAAGGYANKQGEEFKSLVREFHQAGIKILLDVVFNHTAEGASFRGLDNKVYYMRDVANGCDLNYSGCGNTFNCNHPVVRHFLLNCLRYWVSEYHIDGFRFDLASVLVRDTQGVPLSNPPFLEEVSQDPLLANCELIAEPWDASGLYQVGSFPSYGRWKEWNGKYRDCARRFLKGEVGKVGEMVQRILGSPDLYTGRSPLASINFITCHDGFTLADLFSYNEKHNLENGENNQDGSLVNDSWNCGVEGETDDPKILASRLCLQKNAMALLFMSQGVPMIYMGDECGRSQRGNNNAYCHDEPWNWLDWDLTQKNAELLRFVRNMIAFRKAHPSLKRSQFLLERDSVGSGYADISWHGVKPYTPDWSATSQSLAFLLCGFHSQAIGGPQNFIYCAFNSFYEPLTFCIPSLPPGKQWHHFANTGNPFPSDICEVGEEKLLENQEQIFIKERSCAILVGKVPHHP